MIFTDISITHSIKVHPMAQPYDPTAAPHLANVHHATHKVCKEHLRENRRLFMRLLGSENVRFKTRLGGFGISLDIP